MEISSIGFAGWSAREFFTRLRENDIEQLCDVRLRNSSQLAGFAKRDDLAYFLEELVGARYLHLPELAPTPEILNAYKKKDISWEEYEKRYVDLLSTRYIEDRLDRSTFERRTVLLCSEHEPDRCHRRLAIQYLDSTWGDVKAVHL